MSDDSNTPSDVSMNGDQQTPRPRRWIKWALVASLAVNVLIIGFAVGKAYQFHHRAWRDHSAIAHVARQGREFVRDLPRERRRELWQFIKSQKGEFTAYNADADKAVTAFAEALNASDYDPAKVEQALEALQGEAETLLTRGRSVMMEVVGKLSAEERAELAQKLLERGRRR